MATKPHKSTVDRMIDEFDRFEVEAQERVLDQLELVHRLAKRRAVKQQEAPAQEPLALKETV